MKFTLNPAFSQASGAMDAMVFRMIRGKVVASRKPNMSRVVVSEEQLAVRERFKEAAAYGKGVMNSEDMRQMYEAVAKERDMPIFAVMVADYFNAPVIKRLDLDGYSGQAGNVFDIIVTDDFAVARVTVKIIGDQGNILESGDATPASDGPNRWNYNATVSITTPVTIEVVARDFPGGTTVKQFPYALP